MRITPILVMSAALLYGEISSAAVYESGLPTPALCNPGGIGQKLKVADFRAGGNSDPLQNLMERFKLINKQHVLSLKGQYKIRDAYLTAVVGTTKEICSNRRELGGNIYDLVIEDKLISIDPGKCADENVTKAIQQTDAGIGSLEAYKNKINIKLNNYQKPAASLTKMFTKYSNENFAAANNFDGTNPLIPEVTERLSEEWSLAWNTHQVQGAKADKDGFVYAYRGLFASFLFQLQAEEIIAAKMIEDLKARKNSLAGGCKGLGSIAPKAPPPARSTISDGNERAKSKKPDATGTISSVPGIVVENNGPGNSATDPTQKAGEPIPAPPPDPELKEEEAPPPKDEESWLSKNKGTVAVVGIGAAAAGGLLYYYKNEEKKRKKADKELREEARMLAAMQGNSSSNSGSSSGTVWGGMIDAPQGSVLQVSSGIPAGAKVGENIGTVEVSIIAPNGEPTQDSDTVVTVSCASPQPCSIAGTLTVTSQGGKATFNNIRFTSPQTSVRLLFNAPGFSPSAAGSMFNVSPL